MTIDEAVEDLAELARYYISHYGEDSTNSVLMDNENVLAIDTLIDVARKYQKIRQIAFPLQFCSTDKLEHEAIMKICEVLDDGSN